MSGWKMPPLPEGWDTPHPTYKDYLLEDVVTEDENLALECGCEVLLDMWYDSGSRDRMALGGRIAKTCPKHTQGSVQP